jgi:hypothetical protein
MPTQKTVRKHAAAREEAKLEKLITRQRNAKTVEEKNSFNAAIHRARKRLEEFRE